MRRATADDLRRFGFHGQGTAERWCAKCNRLFNSAPTSFKCEGCARKQFTEVERECVDAGV